MWLENISVFGLLITMAVILLGVCAHRLVVPGNTFLEDLAGEQSVRLRYVHFIAQTSGIGHSAGRIILWKGKPWLFRRSDRIYRERKAENLLAEACLKAVLRNHTNIFPLLQVILLGILTALAMPVESKWLGLVAFAFLLAKVVELFWEKTKHNEFMQMFPWKAEDQRKAAVKATLLLFSVFFLPVSFTFGITAYSWPGAALFVALGEITGFFAVQIIQQ